MINLPKKVLVREVTLRDGIQNIKEWIPTETKIKLADMLTDCGLQVIEATSFVHPKWIPQLKDAEDVLKGIKRSSNTKYLALVPNLKGVERAVNSAGVDGVGITMSVSETHNHKNLGMSRKDSMEQAKKAFQLANENGLEFVGGTAVAFGCPMEGDVSFDDLYWVASHYAEIGIKTIRLGDSTGMADPRQIMEHVSKLKEKLPDITFNLHLHNTRGMGLANVLAGMEAGVDFFDGTICGLGGCPYAPGATGNIDTIDLVHMLHRMNIETGINLKKLIEVGKFVESVMSNKLHSNVLRAGTVEDLHDPSSVQCPK